ncbi:MAG: RNA polymerase sigma factor RpoE [Pseudomonadota bacterium]
MAAVATSVVSPNSLQPTDLELVDRARNGEQSAFDMLALRYQGRLAKLVGRYISDPADVLDVVQESLMRAYRALDRFRGDSAFYTWLYRIGVNAAKNHLDARSRRPGPDRLVPLDSEDVSFELVESDTPEQWMRCDEMMDALDRAVCALPPELREALTLRELSGCSYEQIAERMECPIGTVRSRIFRAREAVSRELQPFL